MRAGFNKKVLTICLILCGIAILFSIIVRFVKVDANEDSSKYKYYTSYKIKDGDTLTSIAEENTKDTDISVSEYISELKNDNRLKDDEITEGENLIITYYSDIEK